MISAENIGSANRHTAYAEGFGPPDPGVIIEIQRKAREQAALRRVENDRRAAEMMAEAAKNGGSCNWDPDLEMFLGAVAQGPVTQDAGQEYLRTLPEGIDPDSLVLEDLDHPGLTQLQTFLLADMLPATEQVRGMVRFLS